VFFGLGYFSPTPERSPAEDDTEFDDTEFEETDEYQAITTAPCQD
jgi:hypothetical protein